MPTDPANWTAMRAVAWSSVRRPPSAPADWRRPTSSALRQQARAGRMRASSPRSSLATSTACRSAGGGGRPGDPPLARPLRPILLLDPHQRRGQLARIVPVGVRDVDQVLLDDGDLEALEAALDSIGVGANVCWLDRNVLDRLIGHADRGLSMDVPAGLEGRGKVERNARGGQHLATHGQYAVRLADRLLEVAGDRGHGSDE